MDKAADNSMLSFRRAVEDVLDPHGEWQASQRLIQCTPAFGAYGKVAYWMIVLEGSPPKSAVVVQAGWNAEFPGYDCGAMPIHIDGLGKTKKLSVRRAQALNPLLVLLNTTLNTKIRNYPVIDAPRAFTIKLDGIVTEIVPTKN
jgi:hypothetical protein